MIRLGIMKLIKGIKSMAYEYYRTACKKLSIPINKYELWIKTAKVLNLSKPAKQRLNWIIYYYTKSDKNASLTCRHFGIHRSIWYYWFNRFNETDITTLEDKSSAPHKTREKEYTPLQYSRVIKLRKQYIKYGKVKIFKIYQKQYLDDKTLSEWNVQCIIESSKIYYKPARKDQIQAKRRRASNKKRITELKKKPKTGYLICIDSIVKYWNGKKRYIITAIDKYGKLAYARMYNNHTSLSAKDFLLRVDYLLDGQIKNAHSDNGSEFGKYFKDLSKKLEIARYYSRPHTPKDNPSNERFNQTLQKEWLNNGNFVPDVNLFNSRLKEFIIEYNFVRPHENLKYLTPIEFSIKHRQLSERYSSCTGY